MQPFPRGFVWHRRPSSSPPGYVPGPIAGLHVERHTTVAHASDGRRTVAILGLAVPIDDGAGDLAGGLLDALRHGDDAFHRGVGRLAGRFAIIVAEPRRLRVLGDAAAMRTIFYRTDFGAVASHARLITETAPAGLPCQYGFPGNLTPFADVKLLTANTLLDLPLGIAWRRPAVRRFWPRRAPAHCSAEQAAERVLAWTATAMRNVAAGRTVRLALTAGLDSRVMLAVVKHSGVPFDTYTYDAAEQTETDVAVARDLAARDGLRHTVVPCRPAEAMQEALETATYANHHYRAVEPLAAFFGDADTIAVTANLLEIGRAFYAKYADAAPPVSAPAMKALHLRAMTERVRALCGEWDGWGRQSRAAFRAFLADSDFNAARGMIDPFDQFYWEHRMSAWHGLNMLERDFYAQAFIPFNAHAVWETLLGVPEDERRASAAFHRIIERVDPRLLEVPINPKRGAAPSAPPA